jgi:hypothetical protein
MTPLIKRQQRVAAGDALRLAVGEAFSATLLGVSARELDVTLALADRLLAELRKRGLTVAESAQAAPRLDV